MVLSLFAGIGSYVHFGKPGFEIFGTIANFHISDGGFGDFLTAGMESAGIAEEWLIHSSR